MPSELSSLYKNRPIVLWVEDSLTRTWLHHLWQDADIGLLVAGGNDAVVAAVRDARAEGHANVFGFRDRDFIPSNQARWSDPTKGITVFVPDAFEIESYLLDFAGLAALGPNHNPKHRAAGDLEARAHGHAQASLWWMAARATIVDARDAVTGDFPKHPSLTNPPSLTSQAQAEQVLEDLLIHSTWGHRIAAWVPTLDAAWISARLTTHAADLQQGLANGSWRWEWSGKELFREIAGYMQTPVADLAKGLADHQRANKTVDQALLDLRTALRPRAGL